MQIQRFEAYNEEEEAEWIARQVEGLVGGRGTVADPARRRRRATPLPAARHRGHVPDERPVPGDRGVVPALRHPLPARRRDAVLRAARGQGRAGLPARPALATRTASASSGSSTCRRAASATRRSRCCARAAARDERHDVGRDRARPRAASSRASAPRTRNALAEFAALVRRLRTRVGVLPLPELLDEVLEASGYRAMLADGSEDGEERWANLLELRSVTTRYDDLDAGGRARPAARGDRARRRPGLVRGRRRRGDADHAPRGEGPRVPGRVHRRPRGGPVPAQPGARRRAGARGGAAARLRRDHPGEAAAVPVARLAPRDVGHGPGVASRRGSCSRSRPS